MPTYPYACTVCEHRFEAQQAFTDDALTECPECSGRLRKVFSSVGIVFKGSGFYRTDSRSGSGDGAKAETKAKATSEGGAKAETKGENKAAGEGKAKSEGTAAPAANGSGSKASSGTSGSTSGSSPSSGSSTSAA